MTGVATRENQAETLTRLDAILGVLAAPVVAHALTGTRAVSGTVGPFTPDVRWPVKPLWLTLSGNFTGSVQLLRSTDGGTTKLPLTYGDGTAKPVWTTTLNAAIAEETVAGATYYLVITLTSGGVTYRLDQ